MCSPPLQLVQNGPTGNLPVQPLDPTPPQISNSPTFTDVANEYLDNLDIAGDGYEELVTDATTALAAIDATAVEMDATLDTILVLLAEDPGTGQLDTDLGNFGSDQDGIDSFVSQAQEVAVPALNPVPLVAPGGQGSLTIGAPTGGVGPVTAGSPAYTVQVLLTGSGAFTSAPTLDGLSGPNPPFTGNVSIQQLPTPQGGVGWYAVVEINPAASGFFTATLSYSGSIEVTGISGTAHFTMPINVSIQ